MTEDAPFLLRIGEGNSYRILKLDNDEVTIGSSEVATYNISSQEISQCLIVLRRHDETWTITDIMSSNGIYVNGHHLAPLSTYFLQDGDLVQLGASTSPRGKRKFEYKFCCSFKSKKMQELEAKKKEREQYLQNQNLALEKVENILQSNKIKEFEVKNKDLEQQLQNLNLALEMILMDRQRERASLMEEINESHKKSDEAKQQALQIKDDFLSKFAELMDGTVQCSICTEYFIKATSLDCSHVFCNLCINEWMKIKKLCPNCRTPITRTTQIPALDKCIDKMMEQFSDVVRSHRQELINQRKIGEKKPDDAYATVLSALNAWLRARDRRMETVAARIKAVARAAIAHTRPATIRRTAALTRAKVMTQVHAFRRSETARRAAELTKITVQTGAQAFRKAKLLTTTKMLAGSAVLRRAAMLTKAAAISRSKDFTKSAIFRSAAALAKTAAITGSKALSKSTLLKRAAELASLSAHESSEILSKSLVGKRALALTRAVAQKAGEVFPRTKAVVISKAAMARAATLKSAKTLTKLTKLMKAEVRRKAVEVKRKARLIKAYAIAGVATLKDSAMYTRTITVGQAAPPFAGRALGTITIQAGISHPDF